MTLLPSTILLLAFPCTIASDLQHRYYILRHGQSLANVEGVISSDPRIACLSHGLSDTGWQQAEAAAAEVVREAEASGAAGVVVVSSDLRRAWQTASSVRAGVLAAGIRVWPAVGLLDSRELRERSFGELSGQSDARYADVWVEDAQSADHEQYGVESVNSVRERARRVVDRIESNTSLPPGRWMVVLVAHGDVLQILQTGFAGVDPREHRSLPHLETATLRALRVAGGDWTSSDVSMIDPRWESAAGWPPA